MQTNALPNQVDQMEMVRRIAGAMARHLPAHVDADELVSLGYLGLVEAQTRFDPARGVPFGAFASTRARGAMLDGLRRLDPVSREERTRLRDSGAAPSVRLVDASCADNQAAPGSDAVEELLQRERCARLGRALDRLSERERLVVERHFFEEQPLKNIGHELHVTASRVCQLVGAVLARLRVMMAGDEPLALAA
jgi:RNA polymerase sigma factor for flagellar operon FliA